jgi:hypothetical protein
MGAADEAVVCPMARLPDGNAVAMAISTQEFPRTQRAHHAATVAAWAPGSPLMPACRPALGNWQTQQKPLPTPNCPLVMRVSTSVLIHWVLWHLVCNNLSGK